jgi:hypothetical protein
MKPNLIHLLCLCNYSFRDPQFSLRFKLKRSILTSSMDFYQKVVEDPALKIVKAQSVFHDLPALTVDMPFHMKQYSGIKDYIKGHLFKEKLLYLKPTDIENIKNTYGISEFELSIFYYFVKNDQSQTNTHNVFIVNHDKPVLVLFNPFQHSFQKLE